MITRDRSDIAPMIALLLLGSLALVRLMALPAFEDEGSQLQLAWRVGAAGEWLQPLVDGKPLEAWLMAPLSRLQTQPLAAIRTVHVLSGAVAAVLVYLLALQIGGRGTAFASGVLFALCPFVVYLQRLALADILMCTAGIWVHLRTLWLTRSPTSANAIWLGVALVMAAFCKFPVAFIFLISVPLALVLMPREERRALLRGPALTRLAGAHAPALLLAAAIAVVALVRLHQGRSPGFGLADFIGVGVGTYKGIADVIGIPRPNLITELVAQLSWPVLALGIIGLVASALLGDWRQRWLIAVGMLPMLAIGLLAAFWYSRYLLFTLPPLIIAAVSGWHYLSLRLRAVGLPLTWLTLALCVGIMGWQSALLILDPSAARWSALDRFQYFEGWGSGFGYPEAARFIQASANAPALIYSLDAHSACQLRTYLPAHWAGRVTPAFYGPGGRVLRSEADRLRNLLEHTPAWIVIAAPLLERYLDGTFGTAQTRWISVRPIAEFEKPGGRVQLGIYEATSR
jgi:4-amino-4-deoxy-L-arabinose transferase-like glycosyltransferase